MDGIVHQFDGFLSQSLTLGFNTQALQGSATASSQYLTTHSPEPGESSIQGIMELVEARSTYPFEAYKSSERLVTSPTCHFPPESIPAQVGGEHDKFFQMCKFGLF